MRSTLGGPEQSRFVFSVHHKLGMMIYNRHARGLATKGRALSPELANTPH